MAPTTHLGFSCVGDDICGLIDSYRKPQRMLRVRTDRQGRVALARAQRRWPSLVKKREVTRRFDVGLPPYPGLVDIIDLYLLSHCGFLWRCGFWPL